MPTSEVSCRTEADINSASREVILRKAQSMLSLQVGEACSASSLDDQLFDVGFIYRHQSEDGDVRTFAFRQLRCSEPGVEDAGRVWVREQ